MEEMIYDPKVYANQIMEAITKNKDKTQLTEAIGKILESHRKFVSLMTFEKNFKLVQNDKLNT